MKNYSIIKIICINDTSINGLELNVVYTAEDFSNDFYSITDKNGDMGIYDKYLFKPLNKVREERINKLI